MLLPQDKQHSSVANGGTSRWAFVADTNHKPGPPEGALWDVVGLGSTTAASAWKSSEAPVESQILVLPRASDS